MDRQGFADHGRGSRCRRQKAITKVKVMEAWATLVRANLADGCAEQVGTADRQV